MRNHLKIFYDELWADHVLLSTGKKIKPTKDRHAWRQMQLDKGFKSEKPKWFMRVDHLFYNVFESEYIIRLADNRMMQGDYRYGRITRQNLDNYDVTSEFWRRREIAKETKNLEYLVDMYNMVRIQAHKDKKIPEVLYGVFETDYVIATEKQWELNSVDDGIHAVES